MKEDNYKLPEKIAKDIKLAKYAGFCYGVKRAVETVKKLKCENPDKNVFVLGELIHNTHVIYELEKLGIKTLTGIPEKGEGICVIRSHGESPEVIEKIKQAGFEPVDLTCPDVKKVQQKAIELAKDGYFVVIAQWRTPVILADGSFVSILTGSGYGSSTGDTDEDGNIEIENGADTRIIVDLNASKLPNTFGKDVFLLERVAGKGIMPYGYNKDDDEIDANCSKSGSGYMCAAKLMRDGWEMKNNYPW